MGDRVALNGETTTALQRTTVHRQYQTKALGFLLLSNLVPISVYVRKPAKVYVRSIVLFGPVLRNTSPFSDYGVVENKFKRVYTFNIRHYITCYLPAVAGNNGQPTIPFTYNNCTICGASVRDDNGRVVQEIVKRSYRPDKYIWTTDSSLQNETEDPAVFSHREGVL